MVKWLIAGNRMGLGTQAGAPGRIQQHAGRIQVRSTLLFETLLVVWLVIDKVMDCGN